MARSGSSNLVMINGEGGDATWQPQERQIARGFTTVALHLSEGRGVRGNIGFIGLHFNLKQ